MDSDQYHSRNVALPLVSICTVTCNRPKYLGFLQDCIKSQTCPHSLLEWIILDDSSNQVSRFKAVKDLDIPVTHIYSPSRMKLGKKRNQSHLYCLGGIIVYIDDDDWYPPTRVEHAVTRLLEGEAMIAGSTTLPVLLLPKQELWQVGPMYQNHATANTFAFIKSLLGTARYDDECTFAEEKSFRKGYAIQIVQLELRQAIVCIGHNSNIFDKRPLRTGSSAKVFKK